MTVEQTREQFILALNSDDFEYGINNWGCRFCPDCGQALDWSDNE